MANTTSTKEKNPQHVEEPTDTDNNVILCSFCQSNPAVIKVALPSIRKKRKTIPTNFCLLHYYSTSAVRVDNDKLEIINENEYKKQLVPQQELFAEAYVQLRQELQDTAIEQFTKSNNDPLSILNDLNQTSSKRKKLIRAPKVSIKTKKSDNNDAGGFLRPVPLPERLLRTQQEQRKLQKELTDRMNQSSITNNDTTKRRKPNRKSIWNVMHNDDTDGTNNKDTKPPAKKTSTPSIIISNTEEIVITDQISCSTCGNDNNNKVEILSSNSNNIKNQDMAKAETWGYKDRENEIITRYRCTNCGKIWNEQE